MKIFKLMVVALVAMLGFTACEKDCDHDFIEHDHSADLVGTWTCLTENYAEALIIKADGTAVSYGVEDGKYWENVKGTVTVKDNNITMIFEDDDNWTGHFDVIPGMAFSLFEENGERYIYQYCANDLSDEIIGMWVSTGANVDGAENVAIQTYQNDGKAYFTGGFAPEENGYETKAESTYKVIGNLMIQKIPAGATVAYITRRLTYVPNGTTSGDILICESSILGTTTSWLRVKQHLNLDNKVYDYISAHVTNVKGKDEDFSIVGNTFNMSNITAGDFDIMFRSVLSGIELNANSIKQNFRVNGFDAESETPITVDGNKVTLDMSVKNPAFRKVDMYMFQDADDSQLHIYMPTASFINYFASLEVVTMLAEGKIDANDATAVAKVFADMEARIESVNVSLVYKARK